MVKCPSCGEYDYKVEPIKYEKEYDLEGKWVRTKAITWKCGCGYIWRMERN
jgi:hypothetical protein